MSKRISLTHLCFADDLLIFLKGDLPSVLGIKEVIGEFNKYSGLQLNVNKCELFCSGIIDEEMQIIKQASGFGKLFLQKKGLSRQAMNWS